MVFVPKKDEVTGEWRRLHSEELDGLTARQITVYRDDQIMTDATGGSCSM